MPALINDLKAKGYFKIRIRLDEAFDAEDAEEKEFADMWAGAFIDLRELRPEEAAAASDDPKSMMSKLRDIIVGHNFEFAEGKKASNDDVVEAISSSSTVYSHVMSEWVKHLPLAKRSTANSAK